MQYGAIQVSRNAVGRVSDFPEKSVMKMYASTLFSVTMGWVGGC